MIASLSPTTVGLLSYYVRPQRAQEFGRICGMTWIAGKQHDQNISNLHDRMLKWVTKYNVDVVPTQVTLDMSDI
jgi:hypothetical protein